MIECIKEKYELTEDWTGDSYCGIKLLWDYNVRTLDISMPGCIKKLLHKYKHKMPKNPQHCLYTPAPKAIRSQSTSPTPCQYLPQIIRRQNQRYSTCRWDHFILRTAVDITVLMALSSIASEQTQGTTNMMAKAKQLLGYLATHPNVTIRFRASNMVLNIHSDASYLLETKAHSRACGHFFLGFCPYRTLPPYRKIDRD